MELTLLKLPHGAYTMEATSMNLHNGSCQGERKPWKLHLGTYTLAVTLWNINRGITQWNIHH